MREIKFRAWDKKTKSWITDYLGMFLDGELLKYDRKAGESDERVFRDFGTYNDFSKDNIVLEQFTGLKDRKKVDIYEGDLVQTACGWKYTWVITVINYNLVAQNIQSPKAIHSLKKLSDWLSREVVGNIHENPELLEAK